MSENLKSQPSEADALNDMLLLYEDVASAPTTPPEGIATLNDALLAEAGKITVIEKNTGWFTIPGTDEDIPNMITREYTYHTEDEDGNPKTVELDQTLATRLLEAKQRIVKAAVQAVKNPAPVEPKPATVRAPKPPRARRPKAPAATVPTQTPAEPTSRTTGDVDFDATMRKLEAQLGIINLKQTTPPKTRPQPSAQPHGKRHQRVTTPTPAVEPQTAPAEIAPTPEHTLPVALLGRFATIEQVSYKNGAKHVYGVDEAGKKRHLSHDAILEHYGHAGDQQGKDVPAKQNKRKATGAAFPDTLVDAETARDEADIFNNFGLTPEEWDALSPKEQNEKFLSLNSAETSTDPDDPLSAISREKMIGALGMSEDEAKGKSDSELLALVLQAHTAAHANDSSTAMPDQVTSSSATTLAPAPVAVASAEPSEPAAGPDQPRRHGFWKRASYATLGKIDALLVPETVGTDRREISGKRATVLAAAIGAVALGIKGYFLLKGMGGGTATAVHEQAQAAAGAGSVKPTAGTAPPNPFAGFKGVSVGAESTPPLNDAKPITPVAPKTAPSGSSDPFKKYTGVPAGAGPAPEHVAPKPHFNLQAHTTWEAMHEAGIPDSRIMAELHHAASASGLPHHWYNVGTTDEWLELTLPDGTKVSSTAEVLNHLGKYITR